MVMPRVPHLRALAHGVFTHTVTIQSATIVRNEYGEATETNWTNVSGLVTLKCSIAPVGSMELRTLPETFAEATHVITLAGAYPTILARQRAVDDAGVTYDLNGPAMVDTLGVLTRLPARIVTL